MADITGRDSFIITQALATAIVSLAALPEDQRPEGDIADMIAILRARVKSRTVSLALVQATLKLHPERDFRDVYREFGIDINQSDA